MKFLITCKDDDDDLTAVLSLFPFVHFSALKVKTSSSRLAFPGKLDAISVELYISI